jgi:tRNA-binding EMAP/Myf-like protein
MVIIRTFGATVGEVVGVARHPNAQKLRLAMVRPGPDQSDVQIVFGGTRELHAGDLVPMALPGTRVTVLGRDTPKKMRARSYRGERSHGMLCSLRELGWVPAGLDEVAVLHDLAPGEPLDAIPEDARRRHVTNWVDPTTMLRADRGDARPSLINVVVQVHRDQQQLTSPIAGLERHR